ncbi:NlpC/P60 family protein [Mesorhizobium sp. DCY119]|nr:NlpC/P60 family protein [Mesorhizobium sp. DCY119]RJG46432.1 peptidase P60 [Mesorhizobium sp. DCY119]
MAARSSTDASPIIAEARRWIGTPYRHQGSARDIGCDCLGLVRGVWRKVYGADPELPPPYSSDWAETTGEETLLNAASRHMKKRRNGRWQPGDLLIFRWRAHLPAKHCGIVTEPDRMIHAYQAAGFVAEGSLDPAWKRRIAGVFVFPPIGEAE